MTIYDVHRNSDGAAFKEGAHFEAPAGSTEDWGKALAPAKAGSDQPSRLITHAILPKQVNLSAADRYLLERQHSRRNSTVGEWDSWKPARDLA